MGLLNVGEKVGSRFGGMTGLALGAIGLAGVGAGIGSSAKEAAFDIAFDNPNADEAFMGRPMSSGFLASAATHGTAGAVGLSFGTTAAGAAIGGGFAAKMIPKTAKFGQLAEFGMGRKSLIAAAAGIGGMIGMAKGPMRDTASVYGPGPSVGLQAATTGIGAVIGGAIGGLGYGYNKGFKKAAIAGGIGAIMGGIAGASVVPAATLARVRSNQNLLTSSPYSTSLGMAQALNASGDIVLGMHNSRNGY